MVEDAPAPPPTLPSTGAYVLAFAAIVIAGAFGAMIGYGLSDLECDSGNCGAAIAISTLVGAVIAAGGVGVVATLTLRARAEWQRPKLAATNGAHEAERTDASDTKPSTEQDPPEPL